MTTTKTTQLHGAFWDRREEEAEGERSIRKNASDNKEKINLREIASAVRT